MTPIHRSRYACIHKRRQRGFIIDPYRFGASSAYATLILASAPLGYWRLGESSGTTAVDSSGNGRDGTYVNAPTLGSAGLVSGDADTCAVFNGTTQYVNIAYGAWMNSGNFSVSGLNNVTTSAPTLLDRRENAGGTNWAFNARPGGQSAVISNGTAYEIGCLSQTSILGTLTHTGLSWDGTRLKGYQNGLLKFDIASGITPAQPISGGMRIAASRQSDTPTNAVELTDGKIDEVAFFGSALTAATFKEHAVAAGLTVTDHTYDGVASTARAQLALRAINGYTGALIDVRRSSDNATTTINVASGELDTATLATWGGTDSVYVSKWYDQSGNLHHFEQATAANQPRIVNAGTLETQNGKPVINCLASTWLREATSLIGTTDSFTILRATDTCGFGRGQDTFGNGWSINTGTTSSVVFTVASTAQVNANGTEGTLFDARAFRVNNTAGASSMARDEGGYQRGLKVASALSSLRTSTVGCSIGRSNGGDVTGKIGELLIWRSVLDHGKQQAVTSNLGTRFGF